MKTLNRRQFLITTAYFSGAALLSRAVRADALSAGNKKQPVKISGHIWVYASKFPPDWDSTPVIEQAFADFQYAGLNGMELMAVNLKREDAVPRLKALAEQYQVPITGSSLEAPMWDKTQHAAILDQAEAVIVRLASLNGKTLGISVGNADRPKTEAELDAQADLLNHLIEICDRNKLVLNLHNHTYEVENNLHDLKGTLSRIPGIKLGPDLNWLVRAGVDPVWFINTYGSQIVYMHIRDQSSDGHWSETVGSGVTDFKAIAHALQQQHFNGRAAIELAFDQPQVHPLREDWKNSLEYVRKTFEWS